MSTNLLEWNHDIMPQERRRTPRLSPQTVDEIADAVARKIKDDPAITRGLVGQVTDEILNRAGRQALMLVWAVLAAGASALVLWAKGFFKG